MASGAPSQDILYVNISDFGAIGEKNPFKSRNYLLLQYWCKNNKHEAIDYFTQNGYIIVDESNKKVTGTSILKKEMDNILNESKPRTDEDRQEVMLKFDEKQRSAVENNQVAEDEIDSLTKQMERKLNMACGVNSEREILNETEKHLGKEIVGRNNKMYYKEIKKGERYTYKIGGKVDGVTHDMVIEAKKRTRESTVRKNEYDLLQLMGYLFVTGKRKGMIVQSFGNTLYKSELETDKEWGIITLDERWDNFYQNYLITFFEELEAYDLSQQINKFDVKKPFAYRNGRAHDNITPTEQGIIKMLYKK